MSKKTEQLYQALELPNGASAEEVKKAYFRLVRKYNPEQEPEKFQEIRAAYEALKDGPPKEAAETDTSWINWKYPMTGYLIEEADGYADEGNYARAVKVLEDASVMEPENPLVNLLMARYLIRDEHWQKAAKYAEKVTKKLPENLEAWRIMANGLYQRKWYKKALPAFEKLEKLGETNLFSRMSYSITLDHTGHAKKARKIRQEFWNDPEWRKRNPEEIVSMYLEMMEAAPLDVDSAGEILDHYDHYVLQHRGYQENMMFIAPFMKLYMDRQELLLNHPLCRRIRQSVLLMMEKNIVDQETCWGMLRAEVIKEIEADPRNLSMHWVSLMAHPEKGPQDGDQEFNLFVRLDGELCLLKEQERTLSELHILLQDYEDAVAWNPDYFEKLQQGNLDELYQSLLWQFKKICHKYSGHFEDEYPEEMPGSMKRGKSDQKWNRDFWDMPILEDEEDWSEDYPFSWTPQEPFVREQEKVGRNDPCPCGSGKKFKKCCMGKGIYD